MSKDRYDFQDLVRLVSTLRAPGGCPWDGAQTHLSIRRNFLEEAYEACEGFDRDDPAIMCEELGDVLLQVLFHADIEREAGRFTLDDVCDGVCKKLIFRHPRLFGGDESESWEQIKQREKGQKTVTETLESVSRSLPALWRAEKLVKKSSRAGLAPESIDQCLGKLDMETAQLREAAQKGCDTGKALGDVLFAAVCAAAFLSSDPEDALHRACDRFIRHFSAMESAVTESGASLRDCAADTLHALWEAQKTAPDTTTTWKEEPTHEQD